MAKDKNLPAENGKKEVEIVLTDDTVLNIVSPEIKALLAEPSNDNAQRIGALLTRCVVPIQMGVFDVPQKLLQKATENSSAREEMTPVEIIRVKKALELFTVQAVSSSAALFSDDILDQFTYEGIKDAEVIVDSLISAVEAFCLSMADIGQRYASPDAWYRNEALGVPKKKGFDPSIIAMPIQDLFIALQRLVAGEGGYKILAIVKAIDRVSKFVDNETVRELFGARTKLELLNKLDYRAKPYDINFSQYLCELVEKVIVVAEENKITTAAIADIFVLCQGIQAYLERK